MTEELSADTLLRALSDHAVDFVVIGGFAVIAHGYVRATKDLDVVPDPDPENLGRLADALSTLNARIRGMEEFDEGELPQPDREGLALGGNFVLETDGGRLDILQAVEPDLTYAELARDALTIEALGRRIRVCGYDDLVAMKTAADRDEDRLDLKRLREARS